jgi:predicted permease
VVIQLGLAVLLVIGAGLMLRTLHSIRLVHPGFDPRNILTMEMSLNDTRNNTAEAVGKLVRVGVERLEMLPGVEAAATSWTLPVESAFGSAFVIEGRPVGPEQAHGGALMRPVSPGYARVFRIPILRGRFFEERDTAEAPAVAVISDAMARKFWPGDDPLGHRILVDQHLGPDFASAPRTIVGIAGDVLDAGLTKKVEPMIYEPQAAANGMTRIDTTILPITWSIRTAGDPRPMSEGIQQELRRASGGLPVSRTRTMEEVMSQSTSASRLESILLGSFGAIALLMAGAGLYGLVAYSVQQRRKEMAIRLAVGASPSRVRKMVLAQGARLMAAGMLLGIGSSFGLTRFLSSMIFGVKPVDTLVIASSALVLGGVALLAAYVPARRASEVDPMSSLRE